MATSHRYSGYVVGFALLLWGCSDDESILRPPPEQTVTYRVTFESTWSADTHPEDFPANPHYSSLIGATHCSCMHFWTSGTLATAGIKAVAELGDPGPLEAEVVSAQNAGSAENLLFGGAIATSPGAVSLDFDITLDFPRVTLVSMIAPSPDWFVGVSGLALFDGSDWADSLVVELYPYDAGTDSGTTYTSPNSATVPPQMIAPIDNGPMWVNGELPSVGTFTFVRQ